MNTPYKNTLKVSKQIDLEDYAWLFNQVRNHLSTEEGTWYSPLLHTYTHEIDVQATKRQVSYMIHSINTQALQDSIQEILAKQGLSLANDALSDALRYINSIQEILEKQEQVPEHVIRLQAHNHLAKRYIKKQIIDEVEMAAIPEEEEREEINDLVNRIYGSLKYIASQSFSASSWLTHLVNSEDEIHEAVSRS